MTEELNDNLVDSNRRAFLEQIESLKQIRATAWEEHTHSFRWLMASLLGLNGAAGLGVLGQAEIPIEYKLMSCACFVSGILLALLVAVFGQYSTQRTLGPLQKLIGYWLAVSEDGLRDEVIEADLNGELAASAKIGLGSRFAGWGSALAFLVGAIAAGYGLSHPRDATALEYSVKVKLK